MRSICWQILSDEQKRATYNQFGHAGFEGQPPPGAGGFEGFGGFGARGGGGFSAEDIFETIYPAWLASVKAGPRVLVLDDLQWADSASIDLIAHLFKLVEEVPMLFICAFRPERQSPAWRFP